ncbi:MAG: hypothetical protein FD126_2469 [Elusimicrobia bacterium]|nr:MAG: hypothetical protein FD126_2469 [Elusimicrobiota bacterium]
MRIDHPFPPRTILVPLDLSDASLVGLETARRLAARWRSRVELVHVDEGPPPAFAQGVDLWTTEALARMRGDVRRWLKLAAAPIPHAAAHVLTGTPSALLSRLAADGAADLVVMAPRRRRFLPPVFSGSVTEAAVHASNVPVLAVHSSHSEGWPRRILAPVKWAHHADRALLTARDWAASLGAELGLMHIFEGGEPTRWRSAPS